ncbi:TetR/AcrR family transcriptional regulator [Mycolicibacterium sp. P9-64]|uniref:TetR/AcrR family transcriptional regulator n=1 Tax=Mycolicibacterium sp. P9-64 TaxID=2024612 RepID=UPI0011EDC4C6|nr:TetR/AcrR family transcriptional regulator [Mycolicibacterium sp. P9-64]KAA0083309.1 TetR/AcrR family transcriptional regulator [Mycolicibacterium sp. P9-64]
MRSPIGEGRERLLQALFDEFGESGPSPNLSMRQVAERIGVHHTLLTYHFGSRPSLLGAVLSEARRRDNLVIAADDQLGFVPLCRSIWTFYSNAAHDDRTRAFFHLVGLAVYADDAFQEFVADLDDLARTLEAAALHDGSTATDARQRSVMAIACLRGLLLQRLLTPGPEVDAAAERFITSLAASPT